MNVAVIEPDGGIRCILAAFLLEDNYTVKDYTELPESYDGLDLVIFGPTMNVSQDQFKALVEKNIPFLHLEYFADMDVVMEQVGKFAHIEQYILEDR